MFERLYSELLGMNRETMVRVLRRNARMLPDSSRPVVVLTPELLNILTNRYGKLPDDMEYRTIDIPSEQLLKRLEE